MTLNKQLLCVSLLLLSLPWAGCQYLKEMDASLRQGQENVMQATTKVIATALSQEPNKLHPHQQIESADNDSEPIFYCHPLDAPVWADGYADEWPELPWADFQSEDGQQRLSYRCGIYRDELALFFAIDDQNITYNNPTISLASNGDRLILATGSGKDYIFTAVAPGKITTRYFKTPEETYRESVIDASWIDHDSGYQLEINMPLSLAKGRLSFSVINESINNVAHYSPLKNSLLNYADNNQGIFPPWFVYQAPSIKQTIEAFSHDGLRLRLIDKQGWLTATTGTLETQTSSDSHWLLRRLYRAILASNNDVEIYYPEGVNFLKRNEVANAFNDKTSSQWYRDSYSTNHYVLATAVPIIHQGKVISILISEQSSEQTAALTDQAFSRLFILSLFVFTATALGLLAYASWLSWRIRRLNTATELALNDQNNIGYHYPNSQANDEIGSLTRNYAELMKRIREYTDYLQTLSRKLSHELRTPLAIIHSSLDNLANHTPDEKSQTYQQRAKEGALRLGNILTAMSEARRIEESIEQAEKENTNIARLLWELSQAYSDVYSDYQINLQGIEETNIDSVENFLFSVPDLLVQMLDKLMDNAASFCPEGGKITLYFQASKNDIEISVSNEGPLLPKVMQKQLFDNMVSVREEEQDQTHLGLGLHIVNLIVQYHQGIATAENLADNSGVIFTIRFPKMG